MGYIRVEKITEYLGEHPRKWMEDEDPYVMKTVAVSVAKLHERITPRLSYPNAAVVFSAVKVVMKYMEMMGRDTEFLTNISKKLSPPLVTVLSSEPEVQYVALRNISLIIQKRPDILKHEMKV